MTFFFMLLSLVLAFTVMVIGACVDRLMQINNRWAGVYISLGFALNGLVFYLGYTVGGQP